MAGGVLQNAQRVMVIAIKKMDKAARIQILHEALSISHGVNTL